VDITPEDAYGRAGLAAVERLGGQQNAARRLRLFLRAPDWFTEAETQPDDPTKKSWAIMLLGYCGSAGVDELLPMLRSEGKRARFLSLCALRNSGPEATSSARVQPPIASPLRWCALICISSSWRLTCYWRV
jgi:hypothetical protein